MNATSCYWSYIEFYILITYTFCITYTYISLQACNVIKKKLLHRCFPLKFEKFLRKSILKNIFERLLLCTDYFIICWFLQFTTVRTRFSFLQTTSSLLRNYSNRLMTHEAVSFEEVFHWTKFLAFWKVKISFTEMLHESLKNSLIGI